MISNRDDLPGLTGGALVVLLDEVHDRDTVLTERRTNRRRRRGLARGNLKFDICTNTL